MSSSAEHQSSSPPSSPSSSAQEEEESFDVYALKEEMAEIYARFSESSSPASEFVFKRALPSAPFSSLRIAGLDAMPVPLSLADVEKVKTRASKAPFGRGAQTVLDISVRDAWQIHGGDVSIPSDDVFFTSTVQDMVKSSLQTYMGIDVEKIGIEAKLYKCLLYEAGGHFLRHCDTEKEPGMFGTYLLQLPVEGGHKGGSLVVRHGARTAIVHSSADSDRKFYETMFYADCEHELKEVESGYRCVLAFNLVWKRQQGVGGPMMMRQPPSHSKDLYNTSQDLEELVEKWTHLGMEQQQFLAIPLDHRYTATNLSFQGLKGDDSKITQCFMALKDKLEFYLTLETLHIVEAGDDYEEEEEEEEEEEDEEEEEEDDEESDDADEDDEDEEEKESEVHKKAIVDLTPAVGQKRARTTITQGGSFEEIERDHTRDWININDQKIAGFDIELTDCLIGKEISDDEDIFDTEGNDPDDEDMGGYTGNEGVTNEYWYYRALLVMTPKAFVEDLEIIHNLPSFINRILNYLVLDERSENVFRVERVDQVKEMLHKLTSKPLHVGKRELLLPFAIICHFVGETKLFTNAFEAVCKSPLAITKNVFPHWYYLIHHLGWNTVKTCFEAMWKETKDKQLLLDFVDYIASKGDLILSEDVFLWIVAKFFAPEIPRPVIKNHPETFVLNMLARLLQENSHVDEIRSELSVFVNDTTTSNILQTFLHNHASSLYKKVNPEIKKMLKDFVERRQRLLQPLIAELKTENWSIPTPSNAYLPNDLEAFLRSTNRQFRKQSFNGIGETRNYGTRYLSSFAANGVEYQTGGIGKNAYITVHKRHRPDRTRLLDKFKQFLDQLNSISRHMQL